MAEASKKDKSNLDSEAKEGEVYSKALKLGICFTLNMMV